jgi:hypothetical protein
MSDHDAEMDALLDQLARASLTETYIGEDGRQHIQLTADGERVTKMLAMVAEEDERDAVIDALLGEG